MAQVKIYGIREHLKPIQAQLSDAIHSCVVEALQFPANKRAHRFFHLEAEDLYFPASASARYTIIEISMFEGRSVATKKQLIRCSSSGCAHKPRACPTRSKSRLPRPQNTIGVFAARPAMSWPWATGWRSSSSG